MISVKEKVNYIKSELRNYNFHIKEVIELDEQIEMYNVRLQGVSSPNGNTNEKTSGTGTHPSQIEIMCKRDEFIKKREIAMYHVQLVDNTLAKIDNPIDTQMIRDMFIDKKHYLMLIEKYNYSSQQAFSKHIDSVLKKSM